MKHSRNDQVFLVGEVAHQQSQEPLGLDSIRICGSQAGILVTA